MRSGDCPDVSVDRARRKVLMSGKGDTGNAQATKSNMKLTLALTQYPNVPKVLLSP